MQKCGHRAALASALLPLSLFHFFASYFFPTSLSLLPQYTHSLLNSSRFCFHPHAVLLTDSYAVFLLFSLIILSLLVVAIRAFFLTLLSVSYPFSYAVLVSASPSRLPPPLISCCSFHSVPASRRSPLGAEAAAEGQLSAGGDEAG